MNIDVELIITKLKRNKAVFESMLSDLTDDEVKWKANSNVWSTLEITCHLLDEECEDFKVRIDHVLKENKMPFPQIDPVGWVNSRSYQTQNFQEKLQSFLSERDMSLDYLSSVLKSNWDLFYDHPQYGKMTARMFLTNWLAHDYLHIRQITRNKYQYLDSRSSCSINYAGDW